jgi:transcriptional regulator with XRE-family HTH domain
MEEEEAAPIADAPGKSWGSTLRLERKRLNLNQSQLAAQLGTTQQNIGHWEAGRTLPRAESHEKLVALLGKNSPIATLPKKAELSIVTGTSVRGSRVDNERQGVIYECRDEKPLMTNGVHRTDKKVNSDSNPTFLLKENAGMSHVESGHPRQSGDQQGERKFTDEYLRGLPRMEIADVLLLKLPTMLAEYVEPQVRWKGSTYRPDFLSPGLCVEIKRITGNRLDFTARIGMQQLQVYRRVLEKLNEAKAHPNRTFNLILYMDSFAAFNANTSAKMSKEASLLGIKLLICSSPQSAVETIIQLETRKDSKSFDGTWEDDED